MGPGWNPRVANCHTIQLPGNLPPAQLASAVIPEAFSGPVWAIKIEAQTFLGDQAFFWALISRDMLIKRWRPLRPWTMGHGLWKLAAMDGRVP